MKSDRLYWGSIVRSILFYGVILALCVATPLLVCVAIPVFFLRFYRRPISRFMEDRGRDALGPADTRRAVLPVGVLRIESVPPSSLVPPSPDGEAGGTP